MTDTKVQNATEKFAESVAERLNAHYAADTHIETLDDRVHIHVLKMNRSLSELTHYLANYVDPDAMTDDEIIVPRTDADPDDVTPVLTADITFTAIKNSQDFDY